MVAACGGCNLKLAKEQSSQTEYSLLSQFEIASPAGGNHARKERDRIK
jgi:hypothetical protein